jgi:hypothetical protein
LAARACKVGQQDAYARSLLLTAQTTADTYATDHEGHYKGLSKSYIHHVPPDPELGIPGFFNMSASVGEARRRHELAYLWVARAIEHGEGFVLRTRTLGGHVYSMRRTAHGDIKRSARICGRYKNW